MSALALNMHPSHHENFRKCVLRPPRGMPGSCKHWIGIGNGGALANCVSHQLLGGAEIRGAGGLALILEFGPSLLHGGLGLDCEAYCSQVIASGWSAIAWWRHVGSSWHLAG